MYLEKCYLILVWQGVLSYLKRTDEATRVLSLFVLNFCTVYNYTYTENPRPHWELKRHIACNSCCSMTLQKCCWRYRFSAYFVPTSIRSMARGLASGDLSSYGMIPSVSRPFRIIFCNYDLLIVLSVSVIIIIIMFLFTGVKQSLEKIILYNT